MHIANDQELIALLLPYLSIKKNNSVIKKFGTGKMALEEIKQNPYVLYQKFSGIGLQRQIKSRWAVVRLRETISGA